MSASQNLLQQPSAYRSRTGQTLPYVLRRSPQEGSRAFAREEQSGLARANDGTCEVAAGSITIRHAPDWVVRVVAVLALGYCLYYLGWRLTRTLNPTFIFFSVVFLWAELQGVVNFALFVLMAWDVGHHARFTPRRNLAVDIYIPTYDEDLEILEATLVGCNLITYPHQTYILDDGRRPAVADLAARLGCHYLTRADNQHAKAGNLNAALPLTRGEFVAILDADTIPQPDFLDKTLGYFGDERVALVQLPQEFYNLDSVQHTGRLAVGDVWHEQSLFYRVIQPGKNRWNAAFWCGSPSIIRRAAVLSVGGVATETVTEDIQTSLRLHSHGWKTVYHNEVLAFGIAPQTLRAYRIQRLRWAQGAMQLLRSRENPLLIPGLTLVQRLNYIGSIMSYFDPLPKLTFLLTPAIILTTGRLPMQVDAFTFFIQWLPFFALTNLANLLLGRGYFHLFAVEKYNFLKIFAFVQSKVQLISAKPLTFRVTPKRLEPSAYAADRWEIMPILGLIALEGVSSGLGAVNLRWAVTATYSEPTISVAALFWAMANAGLLGLAASATLRRLYRRRTYRFPLQMRAELKSCDHVPVAVTIQDLSTTGGGLLMDDPPPVGKPVTLVLYLPDNRLELTGVVVGEHREGRQQWRLGIRFDGINDPTYLCLVAHLFVQGPKLQRRDIHEATFSDELALTQNDMLCQVNGRMSQTPWNFGGAQDLTNGLPLLCQASNCPSASDCPSRHGVKRLAAASQVASG